MSDVTFQQALHLISLGRAHEALEKLGEEFDPENPWEWWARALALLRLDRTEEARDAVEQGLAIDAEAPMLLALLARCRLVLRDLPGAEEAILAALRADAEDADNLSLYAHIVAAAGQFDKARKLVERARQIDPENEDALQMASILAVARGDERDALLRSRELLAVDPENVHAHRIAGAVLHDSGRIGEAGQHFRTAVMADPSNPELARVARENLLMRNPFMWPLRPFHRFSMAQVWIGAIVVIYTARAIAPPRVATAISIAWIALCVYSWVVPPLVRRWLNRR